EYGLSRADLRLLDRHADELPERCGRLSTIAELGSGSGEKARRILPELVKAQPVTYCPIDLSVAALSRCQRDLDDIPHLKIMPIEDSYIEGLASASRLRKPETSMLVLFLGSSIGNFDPPVAERFLKAVRENLEPGDIFLLGTDLVKNRDQMLAAYNDSLGLTAAFNLNLLARINRTLGANFDLKQFEHEARYNPSEQRIEMHLRSRSDQTVAINSSLTVMLKKGETIWTESSYKFRPEQIRSMSERAGFTCEIQWIDDEWPFAQSLLRAGK
ncbi:MAG TPA: L-histidine N(alpha)-methyltransferase, partial [Terriglobia bacterium]|nr:L-histidine N(alpha)-methyltransferase [Terriglobia bacterium]